MSISAAEVKTLRERTGAGMMECKKALVECNGDMEAAVEHLRKTGLAKADKKATRVAAEGVIVEAARGSKAVLVEINCETDFVAKDDNFAAFAQAVSQHALDADTVEALNATEIDGETVEARRQSLVAKVGENIQIRRLIKLDAGSGVIGSYLHGTRIGVLVTLEGGDEALARDLAMHVAAMRPEFIDEQEVPGDTVAKEKEILIAQASESGKPPEIIEKMISGRLAKRLAEITLVGQAFVKDGDLTVAKLLAQHGAKVTRFTRLEVGEGIEKEETDFAAEVMQQVQGG
jgi:elongation factor Ts